MTMDYTKFDITTKEVNEYLEFLDIERKDFEKHYLMYDIMFYVLASAAAVVFCRFFDFSLVLTKVIELFA